MSEEKTEQPTTRRLRKARNDGDFPVSSALTQAAGLLLAVVLVPAQAAAITAYAVSAIRRAVTVDSGPKTELVNQAALATLTLSVPLVLAAAAGALAFGTLQTGAAVVPKRIAPDWTHLDPVEGLRRLFRLDRSFMVMRSMVVVAVITWLSWLVIRAQLPSLVASVGWPDGALLVGSHSAIRLLWYAAGTSAALAVLDYVIVRRTWMNQHKMSHEEIRREHKQAEGDPQLKQERRRAHQQMLNSATLNAIKNASVVIINPTHIAVALFYDEEETTAPKVVAQGRDLLARQMIDAARAYGVPVVRDVPVARALHELEEGDEIPEVLYEAVAEILRHVWSEAEGDDED